MKVFTGRVRGFITGEDGPTAAEYAVLLALILAACLISVNIFGSSVSASFSASLGKISPAAPRDRD